MIYKINFDIKSADLDKLFNVLEKYKIDACLADDCLYIYNQIRQDGANSYIMKESKIRNYFIQEITSRPENNPSNYAQNWIWEKFNEQERVELEQKNQIKLQQMMDNINKARSEFNKIKEKYIENTKNQIKSEENVSRETNLIQKEATADE